MKKTNLSRLLLSAFALICSMLILASCNDDHIHTCSDEWSKDDYSHWQVCLDCEEVCNQSEHDWDSGEVTQHPTETSEGSKTFTCNTCGHTKIDGIPTLDAHEHTFSDVWSSNETHHWYSASCEHTSEKNNYTEHNWDDGVVTTEPTTENKGTKTFACQTCGTTKTEDIPKLEEIHYHVYNIQNTDSQFIKSEATCTEKAVYFYSCLCGLQGTEIFQYGSSKGHNYDIANIAWAWNEYESASATVACTENCGHTETLTAVITSEITAPVSCTIDGIKLHTATVELDGIAYTNQTSEKLTAAGHTWNDGEITKHPSETENGIKTYTCSGCSETRTETVYANSQSIWNSAFEKAETAANVTINYNYTFKDGDEVIEVSQTSLLDNYKAYTSAKITELNGRYDEAKAYFAKIDGVNYIFEEEYLNDLFVWVKTEAGDSFDDGDYILGNTNLLLPAVLREELKNSYAQFEYDQNTNTYSSATFTMYLDGVTVSTISITIDDGTITNFNYTLSSENGMVQKCEINLSDYGTTVVTLPHIHEWDNGTITTEPTETENGIKTYTCSGCSETRTETVYANSQSIWNSAFEKAVTAVNATINYNLTLKDSDAVTELSATAMLDNYKVYDYIKTPSDGGGYYTNISYFAKIDGVDYMFEEKYLNGAFVWVQKEYACAGDLYALRTFMFPSDFSEELKNSYSEFEYDLNTNTYSSATFTTHLDGVTISNISIVIENGTITGLNYTITYEDDTVHEYSATICDYDTTVVTLPEAIPACTHSFTVFNSSNLYLCCEFCDEYLRVVKVESEYIGEPIRFIGDTVTNEDISIKLYYNDGTVLDCTSFTLDDTTLQYRNNYIRFILGENYWYGSVQIYAYPVGSSLTDDGFVYTEENDTISIVKYLGTSTDVIVPEEINSKPVTIIGDVAFYDTDITSIILPESIVKIGIYAFGFTKLTSITIPKNVTFISGYAFWNCNELKNVVLEDTIGWYISRYLDVTNSERNARFFTDRYMECNWRKDSYETPKEFESADGFLYTVDDGQITIVDYIGGLSDFTVPSEIESLPVVAIGASAFESLDATSIVLPDTITTIQSHVFCFCDNLTSITIPKSVTSINQQAFAFSGITEIYIHENVAYIDESAFDGCRNLTYITVEENNQYYKSVDGNLYTKDGSILIQYALGKQESSFVIPDSVQEIGKTAFSYTENLISITIPSSVTRIHADAFYNYNDQLTDIIFENTEGWFAYDEAIDVSDSKQNVIYLTGSGGNHDLYVINNTDSDGDVNGDSDSDTNEDSENEDTTPDTNEPDYTQIPNNAFSYNGHYYMIYENVCSTWEEAKIYCENLGGHLATFSSKEENDALYEWITSQGFSNAYFGFTDNVSEGSWQWVNGESSGFTNWHSGEPNSESSSEDYAMFYYKYQDGTWNDGNFDHGTVSDSKVFICEWDGGNVNTDQETDEIPAGYSEFQAEWYAREFSNFDFSYANTYFTSLENDTALMHAINTWSGIHIFAEPSYALGQLKKEDLYMIVIYDLLTGNSGEAENPFDMFEKESMNYLCDTANIIFGTADATTDWELMKKISPEAYKSSVLNSHLFDAADIVSFIFDACDNLYDALQACSRYQAISNMNVGMRNVLYEVYNDESNEQALRDAALKCIDYFDNACNTTLEKILLKEYSKLTAIQLCGELMNSMWDKLITTIFPEAMIVQFALKGVAILGDSLFNLDETNKAFYQLKAAVSFENAVRKILQNNEFDYTDSQLSATYICAVETFQKATLLGLDYLSDLLESQANSLDISDTQKQKYLDEIESIKNIKSERVETYLLFEDIAKQMYQIYYNLGIRGTQTPVTTLRLYFATGNYEGTYTATQGETGASIFVHLKKDILQDTDTLEKYAELATQCATADDGTIQKIYSIEDIKEVIENHNGDFIVLFKYGATEENADIEDGIYSMSISYDWATKTYNLYGSQWIQHDTYLMVDFLNMSLNDSVFSGDAYGEYPVLFWTEYNKLGEISVTR